MPNVFIPDIDELTEKFRLVVRQELQAAGISTGSKVLKDTDEIFNIQQAANFLGLAVSTCYTLNLPSMKKGKRLYYSKRDLIGWLRTGQRKTSSELDHEVDRIIKSKAKRLK
jgi:hypothetical protein